jgi:glycerol-3-phosphate O-acyltransferase
MDRKSVQRPFAGNARPLPLLFSRQQALPPLSRRTVSFFRCAPGPEQTEAIRNLPDDAIVVYISKYKSHFEYLFYHTRYAEEGLPVPEIGFDHKFFLIQPISRIFRIMLSNVIYFFKHVSLPNPYTGSYIREELEKGRAGLIALVEEGGFYLRFVKERSDPLRYLIEMQQMESRPVFLAPQLIFYSKKPPRSKPTLIDVLFGTQENPGYIRRLIALLRRTSGVFAEISEPINLQDFIARNRAADMSSDALAMKLRRQLLDQINRHYQSITGPVLKSVEELKEDILTSERLRNYMKNYAHTRETEISKIIREADGYIREIASKYNLNMIQLFSVTLRWLIRTMFDGISVNTETLNGIKSESRKGPLILVPCHKSHIDYLVLSYVMYHNNMPCPHIAAGKNLSFWPMGPIFRGGGAFFIRRTFKGAVLYSKVFGEYIYKLLQEGFNIEFFIEGGRSRTGKLLKPKLGLLSILLNAVREGATEDVIFVPVFIGYDRVPEEGAYIRELEGGQKKPESLLQVFKARKALKRRYGRIYIQFHEGFALSRLLEMTNADSLGDMSSKEFNTFCRELGYRLVNAIDEVTVITPHAVMAAVILNTAKPRFSRDDLMAEVQTYLNYLIFQKARLADTLLVEQEGALDYVLNQFIHRRLIEPIAAEGEESHTEQLYTVNPARRPALGYYSNNCAKAFIKAAFTALAILDRDAFQLSTSDIFDGFAFLRDIFQNEFAYNQDREPSYFVQKNIKAFIEDAILIPHPTLPDTYNLTASGYRKLKIFAAFLRPYLESYWITLNFFIRYPRNFVDAKDRLKKIQSMGQRMLKKKEVEFPESLSKINYKNAVDFFLYKKVRGMEDEETIRFYADEIRRYRSRLES